MLRIHTLAIVLLLGATEASGQNTLGLPTIGQKDPKKTAKIHYHATQAALSSALAHAEALEALAAEPGGLDTDVALSYVKTINRDINECRTNANKMTNAEHALVSDEHLKKFNSELDQAFKAQDKAHQAIDGHGKLDAPAKAAREHLDQARAAFLDLADRLGAKPLLSSRTGGAKKD